MRKFTHVFLLAWKPGNCAVVAAFQQGDLHIVA